MCKSRNIHTYIHLYPKDGHWEFQGQGGGGGGEGEVSIPEIFNAVYEAKLEIPGRWKGPHQKTILGGRVWIFLGPPFFFTPQPTIKKLLCLS